MAINAFSISWKPYVFYAFPPFSIIPKVLQKIQAEEATGLLVVPCWPTQPWWPLVMRLLVQKPLVLPKKKHLISASTARIGASTAPEAHTSDMPLVRKSLEGRGLSESATSLILQSWRKGTKQQYKPFITKWEQYCSQRKINPFSATIEHGINFLAELYI